RLQVTEDRRWHRTHAANGLDQLQLHDGHRVLLECGLQIFQDSRAERVEVHHLLVQRIEMDLVGGVCRARESQQRLPAKAAPEGEYIALRELSDKAQAEGVFDGPGSAHGGEYVLQARQLL